MKILNKLINFFDNILNVFVYSFFLILLVFGIYSIRNSLAILDESNLSKDLKNLSPDNKYSYEKLKKINEDIAGWISIKDTNIDYPIVKGEDNLEYLNLNYKKEFSLSGSIFMDYRNSTDKIDPYTVIYGHNMERSKMFGDVNEYQNKTYLDNHKEGIIYIGDKKHKFSVFAFLHVDGYNDDIYNINNYRNGINDKLITFINTNSNIRNAIELDNNSKLIVLSTCSRSDEKKRSIIIAKIEN